MLSNTRNTPLDSSTPKVTPDQISGPVGDQSPQAPPSTAGPAPGMPRGRPNAIETRSDYRRRKALRGRLYGYAIAAVALVAVLIALAASNTAHVKVNWLVGSSRVSLVWLVLAAAILGWALGLMTSARFHWRTRAPRSQRGARKPS